MSYLYGTGRVWGSQTLPPDAQLGSNPASSFLYVKWVPVLTLAVCHPGGMKAVTRITARCDPGELL